MGLSPRQRHNLGQEAEKNLQGAVQQAQQILQQKLDGATNQTQISNAEQTFKNAEKNAINTYNNRMVQIGNMV